ncbi:MAG: hypothetical protein M1815_001294 [Lichina confinis]|nr:MAG: hypothetical protein M1815_001294 [Lichina confinis]
MANKRGIDYFFKPSAKKARSRDGLSSATAGVADIGAGTTSSVPESGSLDGSSKAHDPSQKTTGQRTAGLVVTIPASRGRIIDDQPHLDLLYFEPYLVKTIGDAYFAFLRRELFFYRVEYAIQRGGGGGAAINVKTPRFTTVFGVDETSRFTESGDVIDAVTARPVPPDRYRGCRPRPIPQCLDALRKNVEQQTGAATFNFNFCLVNYYASGNDSISYHSDDEAFLGKNPVIASFSLGAKRDFLMRHKSTGEKSMSMSMPRPTSTSTSTSTSTDGASIEGVSTEGVSIDRAPNNTAKQLGKPTNSKANTKSRPSQLPHLKLSLTSGSMLLMRGETQSHWLHSIPKRKGDAATAGIFGAGAGAEKGRINITFRKALVPAGTHNYYRYNVGGGGGEEKNGAVFRWDDGAGEMKVWDWRKE